LLRYDDTRISNERAAELTSVKASLDYRTSHESMVNKIAF